MGQCNIVDQKAATQIEILKGYLSAHKLNAEVSRFTFNNEVQITARLADTKAGAEANGFADPPERLGDFRIHYLYGQQLAVFEP